MQDLTLIGVHEDGLHLLLADAEGNRFTVPLDDSLRAAARRDRPRLGQLQIELTGGLRPAAVQSMIRAGLSAEEVADRAGWTVEKVHRYEGPILAEREHVVGLARQVRLRSRGASHGVAATLEARVSERLRSREIDPSAVSWDSRRADRGEWLVSLDFAAGGRQREAVWSFDPLARTVAALDDESRWLSEDDDTPAPGPLPAPHLSASGRPSRVYDVEAEGGVAAPSGRGGSVRPSARTGAAPAGAGTAPSRATAPPSTRDDDTSGGDGGPVDLVAAMRQRNAQRGRRRKPRGAEVPGIDRAPDDALPLEDLALDPRDHEPPPAQHPRPDEATDKTTDKATDDHRADDSRQPSSGDGSAAPQPKPVDEPAAAPEAARPRREERTKPVPQGATGSAERGRSAAGSADDGDSDELIEEAIAAPAPRPAKPGPARQAPRRSGRPSVPSWDDIMFGRKDD